jgi:hypothetical protein
VALNAKLLAGKVLFSYEMEEDSIIPILPWLQGMMAESGADALEDAYINGDDSATHQDSDIQAIAKHHAKGWKGFRKLSVGLAALRLDASTGGIVSGNIRSLIKLLGKYGVQKRNLILLVGVKGEADLLGDSNVLTVDKVGPEATILTGKVPMIFGVKIITSARVREDLNATGVYDSTTVTKGSYTLVHVPSFLTGRRREFMIETEKDIDSQQYKVVASFRKAFSPIETPSATISTVVTAYNYNA